MKGLRPQAAEWNFLWEVLDLKWIQDCNRTSRRHDSLKIPMDLVCDIRHAWHHQSAGPAMTIVTNSLSFHYNSRRTMPPFELLMQQGWPAADIDISQFHVLPPAFPWELVGTDRTRAKAQKRLALQNDEDDVPAPAKRQRKPRLRDPNNAVTKLAGNGMTLPDCSRYVYASYLCSDDGTLFGRPVDDAVFHQLESLFASSNVIVTFNPATDNARAVRAAMAAMSGGDSTDMPQSDSN